MSSLRCSWVYIHDWVLLLLLTCPRSVGNDSKVPSSWPVTADVLPWWRHSHQDSRPYVLQQCKVPHNINLESEHAASWSVNLFILHTETVPNIWDKVVCTIELEPISIEIGFSHFLTISLFLPFARWKHSTPQRKASENHVFIGCVAPCYFPWFWGLRLPSLGHRSMAMIWMILDHLPSLKLT